MEQSITDVNDISLIVDFENLINEQKKLVERLQKRLKDNTIALEYRWMIYKNTQEILPIGEWQSTICEAHLKLDLMDDLNVEKYETIYYVDLYNIIIGQETELSEEQLNEWKEAVLQKGYRGFVNDW